MIVDDHDQNPASTFSTLVVDRAALVVSFAIFARLAASDDASALIIACPIFCIQALIAALQMGKTLFSTKRFSYKQVLSISSSAIAMSATVVLSICGVRSLGLFKSLIVFRYSEYLLVLTPALAIIQQVIPIGARSSIGSSRPLSSRKIKTILLCIAAAMLIVVFTPSSSVSSLEPDRAESKPSSSQDPLTDKVEIALVALPNNGVLPNFIALVSLVLGSSISCINRRFLSGGNRITGFSSVKKMYSMSIFLAAGVSIPLALFTWLLQRKSNPGDHVSPGPGVPQFTLYSIGAISWFVCNSPNRVLPERSDSLRGVFITTALSFISWMISGDGSIHFSSIPVFSLAFLAAVQLSSSSMISSVMVRYSLSVNFRGIFRHIMETQTTRRIFIFLCLNFSFTIVEIAYGYWNNSIGLISDAVHMLFDCSALLIGLYASYVARLQPNDTFPYGYARFEVLSGFINGIFLVLISFSIFVESVERLFFPPDIGGFETLVVAVLGLLVNMVGILFFHDIHGHAHGGSGSCDSGHNSNMEGIYLHVVADALGSVGVIISSLCVHFFNWKIADPICSLVIAVLIFISVFSLLKESSLILLQRVPAGLEHRASKALNDVASIKGVVGYRDFRLWSYVTKKNVGSVCVHIDESADCNDMLSKFKNIFRNLGIGQMTIQVEKEEFVSKLDPETRTRYHGFDPTLDTLEMVSGDCSDHDGHSHSHGAAHSHSHGATHSHSHGDAHS